MSDKRCERLIVRKPVNVSELPSHKLGEVLPFPVLMGKDLVSDANAWALYVYIKEITQEMVDAIDQVVKVEPHKHEFDEMYLMIGDPGAITFEIMLDGEYYEVTTPGAVYIPKGMPHSIRPAKAKVGLTGGLIPIYLNGEYRTIPV